MLMIVIIRCEECALCRTDYRSNSLKPSNYPDCVGWAAGLLGKKTEIFVYLSVRRILIGDTDTDTEPGWLFQITFLFPHCTVN